MLDETIIIKVLWFDATYIKDYTVSIFCLCGLQNEHQIHRANLHAIG